MTTLVMNRRPNLDHLIYLSSHQKNKDFIYKNYKELQYLNSVKAYPNETLNTQHKFKMQITCNSTVSAAFKLEECKYLQLELDDVNWHCASSVAIQSTAKSKPCKAHILSHPGYFVIHANFCNINIRKLLTNSCQQYLPLPASSKK